MNDVINKKKRGFWLAAFLILMLVIDLISAFVFSSALYFSTPEQLVAAFPNASLGLVYVLAGVCISNIVIVIGVWMWQEWAIIAFYAVVALSFCVNLYLDAGIVSLLKDLIVGGILFLTTRNKLEHFV